MSLIKLFLVEQIMGICTYAGFIGIFAMIFYLYNIRMDAVKYAFLLSAIWLFLHGVIEYIRYRRRHDKLKGLGEAVKSELSLLPDAATLIEEDYQSLLKILYDEKTDVESAGQISRRDMLDYYSMWVHQIKTPIAAMHVILQSCEESIVSGNYLRELKMELFKIEQYAEMVLTYLRMEDISSDLAFELYSLDDIVKQAVRKYSKMFILKKIKLNYTSLNEMVLTDDKWLVFILEQLLSNALKYTMPREAGQPKACIMGCSKEYTMPREVGSISIYMSDYKGHHVLVIEDSGIGIQPEDLPRVFEKGFTGYNGRADKKSTGIGLYLCKTIMDNLRHKIWIESEVDKGTRVYLALGREELTVE